MAPQRQSGALPAQSRSLLRRRDRALALDDQAVGLRLAVDREVEGRTLVALREIEIAARHAQFVAERRAHGDRLARRRDDLRLPDVQYALLVAGLGDAHDPRAVLVGARLHRQLVVEVRQRVVLGCRRVVQRRIVAEQDHLHALQAHHAIGFRPAPVIADAHAHDAAERARHGKSQVADLEIGFLQVLGLAPGLVVGMPRQVHLAILQRDAPRLVDEDRRVEAPYPPVLLRQLRIAQHEADAEPPGLGEQGLGLRRRHLLFEEGVDLRLFAEMPAREEGREREFGIGDDIAAVPLGLLHQRQQARDHGRACFRARDGSKLRRSDRHDPRHEPAAPDETGTEADAAPYPGTGQAACVVLISLSASSRSSRRSTLPTFVFGRSFLKRTYLGFL